MTGKERLLTLADFLEKEVQPILDGAKFDMGDWGRSTLAPVPRRLPTLEALSACGFAACAIGWGKMCPALRREQIPVEVDTYEGLSRVFSYYRDLGRFFGLPEQAVRQLFHPLAYRARQEKFDQIPIPEVVARIRETAAAMPA